MASNEYRSTPGLVHVRTPTYKRPELLERSLRSLIGQTWPNWICDVFDDDPHQSAKFVCDSLNDPRVVYHANKPQRFASKNIDLCFSRLNPHEAEFFFVLEDDNYVFDHFIEKNIELCRSEGVDIVLRNQVVDYDLTGQRQDLSSFGILEGTYFEGRQRADIIRLGAIAGIGVSNGAIFWSSSAKTDLEIGLTCNASLQEYLRTMSIIDDTFVALTPLAAWASNGTQTTRDLGDRAGYLKRELDLKKAIQVLRRSIWKRTNADDKKKFLGGSLLANNPQTIRENLERALIFYSKEKSGLSLKSAGNYLRGIMIAMLGRIDNSMAIYVADQSRNSDYRKT